MQLCGRRPRECARRGPSFRDDHVIVANALNRHLLISPMLPNFNRDSDGGITQARAQ